MASKIRVLSDHTINKIAAGEVIENPASVVKELVENSLDAGADEISIEIAAGGRQLIRISDNGCGMNHDDVLLCLERHATSKIKDFDQLHFVSTMGFRGEAIPSIAAISKFMILSCPKAADSGEPSQSSDATMAIVEGGNIVSCSGAARAPGTTIEVKNLFFNVPVRRKFQKAPQYDTAAIVRLIGSFALAYPYVQFHLTSDHKMVFSTPVRKELPFHSALKERVEHILGADFCQTTVPCINQMPDLSLQGFIGIPSETRNTRTGQYLYINKRLVYSHALSAAVKEGYGTTLTPQRHPVFVLHLDIPTEEVDVNVHPQKKEVRLQRESHLFEFFAQSVEKALQGQNFSTNPSHADALWHKSSLPTPFFHEIDNISPLDPTPAEFPPSISPAASLPQTVESTPNARNIPFDVTGLPWESEVVPSQETSTNNIEKNSFTNNDWKPIAAPALSRSETQHNFFQSHLQDQRELPRVIATIPRYVLVDGASLRNIQRGGNEDGLCVVDQSAAHLRILYERLLTEIEDKKHIDMQSLLLPITFELTYTEADLARQHLASLSEIGISIREFGPQTFVVDALASNYERENVPQLIGDILRELSEYEYNKVWQKEKEKRLALIASKNSVSKDKRLSLQEAQGLIEQLMICKAPYQCPLGKPTLIFMRASDLAKQFQTYKGGYE